jgi:hypothetical protein
MMQNSLAEFFALEALPGWVLGKLSPVQSSFWNAVLMEPTLTFRTLQPKLVGLPCFFSPALCMMMKSELPSDAFPCLEQVPVVQGSY